MMADQSQALVVSTQRELLPSTADWQLMQMMADSFAKSGEVAGAKSIYLALVIMQKGRELGIPPMQALSSISVIKGKPATSAELMRALIYRDQGDDALRILVHTSQECRISYKRRSWTDRQECSFTQQDAVAAGLWNGSEVWKKFPAAMLLARCTSIVARAGFPDVIGGMYEEYEAKEIPETLEGAVIETDHGSTVKATGEITQLPPRRVTVHEPPPAATADPVLLERLAEREKIAAAFFATLPIATPPTQDAALTRYRALGATLASDLPDPTVLASPEIVRLVEAAAADLTFAGSPQDDVPVGMPRGYAWDLFKTYCGELGKLRSTPAQKAQDRSLSYAAAG